MTPASEYSEDRLVQKTTAEFLHRELGWDAMVYAHNTELLGPAGTLGRTHEREVVLVRELRNALERLNPGRPTEAYAAAVDLLAAPALGRPSVEINRELYDFVRDGVPVRWETPEGETRDERLRVLDFADAPGMNRFLAVRELWVQGAVYRRRPDLIGFVNGLPLLFLECKRSTKDVRVAYEKNYRDYRDTIPHLFHHNALVMLSNGITGRVGTITAPYGKFGEWKRLAEEEAGSVTFETMLRGVCSRRAFLDLVENFLLFDTGSRYGTIKVLARNHQYLGVNRALDAVRERRGRGGKLGVFWHTQGSGKSYSMVFLTRKIERTIGGGFTFVVVTDRTELDRQIGDTYAGVGVIRKRVEHQAASGEHLKQLIAAGTPYVFTLIQKFNEAGTAAYSTRDDVIVLADEAHRTQYGKLAENMRAGLPNAAFIAFTGTPLMDSAEDQLTRRVFGDYVSTYDFRRAVDDGATVRLFYDARGEKLGITTPDLNDRIADVLRDAEERGELDQDGRAKLEQALQRDYAVLTAPDRLRRIADDLVAHYVARRSTGKAMLVCLDKVTCVKMWELIADGWQRQINTRLARLESEPDPSCRSVLEEELAWLLETDFRVMVSEEQNEMDTFRRWRDEENAAAEARCDDWRWELDIVRHRQTLKRHDSEKEFQDPDHPFRVAIVCAMWLTGFDVPSLSTLYLDKPMKGHSLMQAIARANRVWEDKSSGLLVDYNGMLKSLRAALAKYGEGLPGGDGTGGGPEPDATALAGEFEAALAACEAQLTTCGFDIATLIAAEGFAKLALLDRDNEESAVNAVCRNDETRARFEVLARETFRRRKALLGRPDLLEPMRRRANAVEAIYAQLQDNRETADITQVIVRLYGVVGEAVVPTEQREAGTASGKVYDISAIDFDRLRREFARSATPQRDVMALKDAVEQQLERMVARNPLRVDFYERFRTIVDTYNRETDRAVIERTFEELLAFVQSLGEEDRRAVREGLDEEHLAVFDLLCLQRDNLDARLRQRVKAVAVGLLDALRAELARLEDWRSRPQTQAKVRTFIYDYLFDERTGLPESYPIDEVRMLSDRVFEHVYTVYGRGPGPGGGGQQWAA